MWIGDNIRDFPGLDQRIRAGGVPALRRLLLRGPQPRLRILAKQSATLTDPRHPSPSSSHPVQRTRVTGAVYAQSSLW